MKYYFSKNNKTKKNRNDEISLPPIEDLTISIKEEDSKCIGYVLHSVENEGNIIRN